MRQKYCDTDIWTKRATTITDLTYTSLKCNPTWYVLKTWRHVPEKLYG